MIHKPRKQNANFLHRMSTKCICNKITMRFVSEFIQSTKLVWCSIEMKSTVLPQVPVSTDAMMMVLMVFLHLKRIE